MLSNGQSPTIYIEAWWLPIDNFNKFNFKAQSVTCLLHVIKPIIDARDDGPFYALNWEVIGCPGDKYLWPRGSLLCLQTFIDIASISCLLRKFLLPMLF